MTEHFRNNNELEQILALTTVYLLTNFVIHNY